MPPPERRGEREAVGASKTLHHVRAALAVEDVGARIAVQHLASAVPARSMANVLVWFEVCSTSMCEPALSVQLT